MIRLKQLSLALALARHGNFHHAFDKKGGETEGLQMVFDRKQGMKQGNKPSRDRAPKPRIRVAASPDFFCVFPADPGDFATVARPALFEYQAVAVARVDAGIHEFDHVLGQFG